MILGDSVTDGHGSSDKIQNSWPAEFYKLIQDDTHFEIYNCAYAAKTISRKSGVSFMDLKAYKDTLNSKPDLIII